MIGMKTNLATQHIILLKLSLDVINLNLNKHEVKPVSDDELMYIFFFYGNFVNLKVKVIIPSVKTRKR
jgi:hypothetical protein